MAVTHIRKRIYNRTNLSITTAGVIHRFGVNVDGAVSTMRPTLVTMRNVGNGDIYYRSNATSSALTTSGASADERIRQGEYLEIETGPLDSMAFDVNSGSQNIDISYY